MSDIDYSELLENAPAPRRRDSVTISVQIKPGTLFFLGILAGVLVAAIPLVFFVSRSNAETIQPDSQNRAAQAVDTAPAQPQDAAPSGSCGSGGCGCGGGARPEIEPQVGSVQNELSAENENIQVIKSVYTYDKDIVPNTFTVKKDVPVRFELDVREDGDGCMSTIAIPELSDQVELLVAEEKIIMEFTPAQVGDYPITCAMGVPRGTIKVVD